MARGFETGSDNEKIDELQIQLDDIIDSQIYSVGGNENISIDSTRGSRNDAGGDSGGIRSNQPIIHTITDIDSSGTPTAVFDKINIISSMAIIDHTVANIDLKFIQGTVKDGVIIKITPKIGKTITVKTGGNILTASDIVITDQQYYELVKHSQAETGVTGGAYKIFLSGTGGGTTLPVVDTTDIVKGSVDATKLLRFEVDGFTTATTRTITIPNATTTMAGLGVVSQTWTGTNIFAGNTTVRDTNFFIQQTSDITKQLKFDIDGATTGKVLILDSNHTDNRTLTFPNATTSLAGLGVVSQQWTGTNDFFGITLLKDAGSFELRNGVDITKIVQWDLSAITTATTRTITMPDADVDLGSITGSFSDADFDIHDNVDVTKIAKFECSAITTGTTRTYTLPDDSAGLVTVNTVANFANKNFKDATCAFINNSDNTKKVLFDLAGITTATTRTWTMPDATTTFAGLGVTSQSWTGTNIFVGITNVRTDNNFIMQDPSDTTKQVKWNLSGITTGTTRTITMPDADVTLGGGGAFLPLAGGTMSGNINMGAADITNIDDLTFVGAASVLNMSGGDITGFDVLQANGSGSTLNMLGGAIDMDDGNLVDVADITIKTGKRILAAQLSEVGIQIDNASATIGSLGMLAIPSGSLPASKTKANMDAALGDHEGAMGWDTGLLLRLWVRNVNGNWYGFDFDASVTS